jgi:hypothetical protein
VAPGLGAAIYEEVQGVSLAAVNAMFTKIALWWRRCRAYSPADFDGMAGRTSFGRCEVRTEGIGLDVRLTRPAVAGTADASPGSSLPCFNDPDLEYVFRLSPVTRLLGTLLKKVQTKQTDHKGHDHYGTA